MSPRKLLILTAAVLVLFAFIVFFERKMPSTAQRQENADLVWDLPQDRIVSIKLEHGGSVVELKKGEGASGTWRLMRPESYPADAGSANDVVSQLAHLRRAGTDAAEAKAEDYGFQSPSAQATILWRDPANPKKELSRTLEFGIDIPGTDSTAARQAGSDRIFFVPSSLAALVKKSADDFKTKDVFTTSASDAARLDVERGRGRILLSRIRGAWRLEQPFADLADGDAVSRLIGDLTALRASTFLAAPDRQNLASLGLAPPLYRVTLADSKGASTTVDIGATRSDGNSVYARRETQVFTVGSAITEELSKEAEAFRDPRLVEFDRAKTTSMTGSFAGGSYALQREASGWSSGGKPVTATVIDDLFSAIADLKSRSFVDASEAVGKGRQPEATVTLKAPGEEWTIRLFPFRDEGRALVSGRPGAFALPTDPTASLQAAFQKVVATVPLATPSAKK